jgi:hypothetical protein
MNVSPHCNDPMYEFIDRLFSAQHKAPESRLSVAGVYAAQVEL